MSFLNRKKTAPGGDDEQLSDDYSCLSGLVGEDPAYSWEELKYIEGRRRAILERVELPFWKILGYWDGTCLKVLVKDALFWVTLVCYVVVRVQALSGRLPEYLTDLEDTNIDIIGGFLSFFLVLFVNQSNGRFTTMYGKSMSCASNIEHAASVAANYFPKANAHRLVRYLNAAHAAGYVGLASDTYSARSFFVELNNIHGFLNEREMQRMMEIGMENGGNAFRELILWSIKEVKVVQDQGVIDARMSGETRGHIQKLRGAMTSLYDFQDQPIHFFYIHFLSLLTAFYLPLFAVATAYGIESDGEQIKWTAEIVTGLIVFLQAVFVIGLRLLGQVMLDPFGDDYEDLSVMHYVQHTWKTSNCILFTQFPQDLDVAVEDENINKTRTKLGSAWVSSAKKDSLDDSFVSRNSNGAQSMPS